MPRNRTVVGKGWMRKRDWEKYGFFDNNDSSPPIYKRKGKKEDWDDADWPPVKVEFTIANAKVEKCPSDMI